MYKKAIGALGGRFMISREVKALCDEHGLGRWEMYFRGRLGVLGEVDAEVVVAVATFFEPGFVRARWEGRAVAARREGRFPVRRGLRRLGPPQPGLRRRRTPGRPPHQGHLERLPDWPRRCSPAGGRSRCPTTRRPERPTPSRWRGSTGAACTPSRWPPGGSTRSWPRSSAARRPACRAPPPALPMSPGFCRGRSPIPYRRTRTWTKRARAEELTDVLVAPAYTVLTDGEARELGELLKLAQASVN